MNSRMAMVFFLVFVIAAPYSVLAQWRCPFYYGCGKRQVCKANYEFEYQDNGLIPKYTNCHFQISGGLYNRHNAATRIDLHLSFIYWNYQQKMGFQININITWQNFVIILLPSPLFWIFFLQSNLYCTATLGEMGGGCLIWVTLNRGSSGITKRHTRNVNLFHGITWIKRHLSVIASFKTKPNYIK